MFFFVGELNSSLDTFLSLFVKSKCKSLLLSNYFNKVFDVPFRVCLFVVVLLLLFVGAVKISPIPSKNWFEFTVLFLFSCLLLLLLELIGAFKKSKPILLSLLLALLLLQLLLLHPSKSISKLANTFLL